MRKSVFNTKQRLGSAYVSTQSQESLMESQYSTDHSEGQQKDQQDCANVQADLSFCWMYTHLKAQFLMVDRQKTEVYVQSRILQAEGKVSFLSLLRMKISSHDVARQGIYKQEWFISIQHWYVFTLYHQV